MSLFRFPHLICPRNHPVTLAGFLPLLFPLPSTPHPLSSTQLRSSYQLPTSPDGRYRCPELSTAGLKGLLIFLFLHLLIFPVPPSFCSQSSPKCLPSSPLYPTFVHKIYWMNPCRFLTTAELCSHYSWRNIIVLFCLQIFARLKRNFWLSWQEKRWKKMKRADKRTGMTRMLLLINVNEMNQSQSLE